MRRISPRKSERWLVAMAREKRYRADGDVTSEIEFLTRERLKR
ncbi:hypothetical protein [Haladaptatus sp. W1]|nr:hypothetical protein [Haladaptatus sp. W1]